MRNFILILLAFAIAFFVYSLFYGSWLNMVTGALLVISNALSLYNEKNNLQEKR
jgi:hypothetical protein